MATSLNQMTIELGDMVPLTPKEYADFKSLFKWLLYASKGPSDRRVRGNVTLALDGAGAIGRLKVESFVELNGEGQKK